METVLILSLFTGFAFLLSFILVPTTVSAQTESPEGQTEARATVLGAEPGNVRMQNDDIGIILWGPDDRPTISVGKSDVWDRRLIGNMPITIKEIKEILLLPKHERDNPAARSRALKAYESIRAKSKQAYNNHDFPCPKPVGQLILGLPFMREGQAVR